MELAHQPLRAAVARKQIQIDFRLAKLRVRCGNHVGAGQYQFVTATQCGAIDRRDHGFAELLQCSKCGLRGVGRRACRLYIARLAYLQQLLDVRARNKGSAGARYHDGIDIILML